MSADHTVLFLCLGNICRSPLAEGIFRREVDGRGLAERFVIDSAGTGGWHVGEPPDPRSIEVAARHGIDITGQRSRQLATTDYRRFDWIVAMDRSNGQTARSRAASGATARVVQFMDYVPNAPGPDVPDPYYGPGDGFQRVYDLLDRGAGPLLDAILGR